MPTSRYTLKYLNFLVHPATVMVSSTLPITHLPLIDNRLPPHLLHILSILHLYLVLTNIATQQLQDHPSVHTLLYQKLMMVSALPITHLPGMDTQLPFLLQKLYTLPMHLVLINTNIVILHLHNLPLFPTLIYQHTSPSLFLSWT